MSRRNSKHSKPRPKASPSEPQNARAEAAVVPDPELVLSLIHISEPTRRS